MRRVTQDEWMAEGTKLFGPDMRTWPFVCPTCGHVATAADYKAAGAPDGAVGFSCVGRWIAGSKDAFEKKGPGPCTYAGGGLFVLNPVEVTSADGKSGRYFEFAKPEVV